MGKELKKNDVAKPVNNVYKDKRQYIHCCYHHDGQFFKLKCLNVNTVVR